MTKRQRQKEQAEARESLEKWLKPGATLLTVIKNVSRSGMQRTIQVLFLSPRGSDVDVIYLGWNIAKFLGMRYDDKREGIVVNGCGMDMGFHIINNLSMALFCPDKYDHDAAYSLKQRWI